MDGDLVVVAGLMLGHARLDGEAKVYHLRSMRVASAGDWELLAWQSLGALVSAVNPLERGVSDPAI